MDNSTNQCALKYLSNCIRNNLRGPKSKNFLEEDPRPPFMQFACYIKPLPQKKFLKETLLKNWQARPN